MDKIYNNQIEAYKDLVSAVQAIGNKLAGIENSNKNKFYSKDTDAFKELVSSLEFIAETVNSEASEKVQSDWSQNDNTKQDYIKNKPTIPAAQIQADWNQTSDTAKDYIKNKPVIPSPVYINGLLSPDSEHNFLYIFTPHSTYRDEGNVVRTQMTAEKKQQIANAVKYGIPVILRMITTADSNNPGECITATQNFISYDNETGLPSSVTLEAAISDGHWGNGMYVVKYEFDL